MPYYRRVGEVPPKRHTQFRAPDGALYAEELMGTEGFSSASSLLYHRHPPTALVAAEPVPDDGEGGEGAGGPDHDGLAPNEPLLPRHLRTAGFPVAGDLVTGRVGLVANEDVRIGVAHVSEPSGLYRNAAGDELIHLRTGAARLESSFGMLDCVAGDHVVVPTGTTHRWVPVGDQPVEALVVEARGHIAPPARYLSETGQHLEHSPYCERDIHGPEEPLVVDDGEADVLVRTRGGLTRYRYAHHPFDVVGWDGCLYPHRLSIHDFEPITGRIHQPPPVHQTFAGPRFVVCSFVPRRLDDHPLAVPVPYNHANVDSDEVLYYCGGDFTSRRGAGIEAGSLTLHPAGFVHGPQPGSVEAGLGRPSTDELAVMIDTFRPLGLTAAARGCDDGTYPWSWASAAGRPDVP
ncbi:MAG TPA: homogentisate 1,2-dioxygenase [Acidimicrobiales bacterium]|nr:homogentisate 1,2-dioxygenase [Acidimicrobiales bacterium]